MIGFTIDIPNENRLIARLDKFPISLRARLRPVIEAAVRQLLGAVIAAEPRRTGALRAATQMFVDEGPDWIRGRVRILGSAGRGARAHNIAAAALEYGAHGTARVQAHQRRLNQVFGRRQEAQSIMVDAYTRRMNITARRFLRDPAATARAAALPKIEAAIQQAIAEEERQT